MRLGAFCVCLCLLACDGVIGALDDAGSDDAGGSAGGGEGGGVAVGGGEGGGATGGGAAGGDPLGGGGGEAGGGTAVDAGDAGGGHVADAGLIEVFVAIGKQQRRAISCDDGRTWVNDVAVDDGWAPELRYRCWGTLTLPDGGSQNTDCDHNAYSTTSLLFAGGVFVHTMGWGAPGTIFRSANGVDWQQVDMGANATDVMYDDGRFLLATRSARRSDDGALTWQSHGSIPVTGSGGATIYNVRGGVAGGGVYLVSAQDGANLDYLFSEDRGETWERPQLDGGGRLDGCGATHPAYGAGVFVTARGASGNTIVCRSGDGARTWTQTELSGNTESRLLWTGTEFIFWSPGQVHRSPDGLTWSAQATQTRRPDGGVGGGPNIGAAAVSPSGTFVGVRGGWNVWYEDQRFYRSLDGVLWDELPADAFRHSHPVTMISSGTVERSAVCP